MGYRAEVLADSPAGFWKLDETAGTTAVDSGPNGIDGTYAGTFTVNGGTIFGYTAVDLVTDGRVEIPDHAALSSQAGASGVITLEAIVRADSVTDECIVAKGGGGGGVYEYEVWFDSGNIKCYVWISTGGSLVVERFTSSALSAATDYHIAFTYNRATQVAEIYVDGVNVADNNWAFAGTNSSDTATIATIGRRADNAHPFDGRIAMVAIYPSELSAARILAHYNALTSFEPDAPTGLVTTAGNERAGIEWTAPYDNGLAITDYDIDWATAAAPTTWLGPVATGATDPFGAVTGLTNGIAYVFRVRGVNSAGDGAWSATSASATPADVTGWLDLESGDEFLTEQGTDRILLESGAPVGGTDAAAHAAETTVAADGTSASVAPNANVAAVTATAEQATGGVGAAAGNATSTGTAENATTTVTTNAGLAASTAVAAAAPAVTVNAQVAESTAAAFDATVSTAVNVNAAAEAVETAAVANNAAASVAASSQAAEPAAAADNAAASVAVNAQVAESTAAAFDATVSLVTPTNAPAESAETTAVANNAASSVAPVSAVAGGTATAENPTPSVTVNSENAAVTAAALDATVSTATATQAFAQCAETTAAVNNAATSIAPTSATAESTGSSNPPSASITVTAENAGTTAAAFNATVTWTLSVFPGVAETTGIANSPAAAIGVAADVAAALAEAWDVETIPQFVLGTATSTVELVESASSTVELVEAAESVLVLAGATSTVGP